MPKLLDFVVKQSSTPNRVKWVVSSRNWPEIAKELGKIDRKVRLSLELNAECVSTAVNVFIKQRVAELALRNRYKETLRDAVRTHLVLNANKTFL